MGNNTSTNPESIRTKVKTESFNYEWIIENFQFLEQQNGQALSSPYFAVGSSDISLVLDFYPRGIDKDSQDFVSLFVRLQCKDGSNDGMSIKYELAIIKAYKVLVERQLRSDQIKQTGHGWERFFEREKLVKECQTDDSFIIRCKIERSLAAVTELSAGCDISFDLQKRQLAEDCRCMFKLRDEFSDVIISVKGREVPAHKFLLIARSSVFTAMFRHKDLRENRTNKVEIEDVELDVVEAMLEFIYTDEVTDLAKIADRLIAAAEKYDLPRLKTMCEEALCKNLDTKKAVDVLLLANLYGSEKFINHVIGFVATCFRQGLKIENYAKIEDSTLLKKVTYAIAGQKNE